jgi:DNA-binding NtrC family response regulator
MPATILIVDDEKNTREGLCIALEEEYEVYMASGADEAFNLMEAESFDIVLTDLRMAGKSGLKGYRSCYYPSKPADLHPDDCLW